MEEAHYPPKVGEATLPPPCAHTNPLNAFLRALSFLCLFVITATLRANVMGIRIQDSEGQRGRGRWTKVEEGLPENTEPH